MDIVLESGPSSGLQKTSVLRVGGEDSRTSNQENQCQYPRTATTTRTPSNNIKDTSFNSNNNSNNNSTINNGNNISGSISCTSIRTSSGGGISTGASSTTSSSTTSVGSGGSEVNTTGHSGGGNYRGHSINNNHGRPNAYYRPHLRQNFNNYTHYNNGNGNNYHNNNNGGGRQNNYHNNSGNNGGGYNSGGYHQNNMGNQSNGGYRRNYGNKRHYPGEYYPHQGQGGHNHYYHNNHNNYNMNSRPNVQHSQHLQPLPQQHHNHNTLSPSVSTNSSTNASHGNHHYHSHASNKPMPPPPMNMYPHCWPPATVEVDPGYKSYSRPVSVNDSVSVVSEKESLDEVLPCPPNQWLTDVTLQFDVKAPPPPLTMPPLPYPPTWLTPSSSGDSIVDPRFHFNSESEGSNSDDSLKDSRLLVPSTTSSPRPKSPGTVSIGGHGDGLGKFSYPYYGYHWQQRIDPEELVEAFKFFEIKITPDLVAPKDSQYGQLSQAMWNKFEANQQTTETFRKKMELWRDVFDIIQHIFPSYGLQIVGSTMSGFGSNTSDVDMCLLIRRSEVDQRFEAVDCLHNLWSILRDMTFLDKTEVIYAKVPILKFRDCVRNLEVDLNCNNSVGIRNTHLLYCYSQQDWRVRPLVLIVKMWAQYQGINDAKNMTVSSYSLVLMVIHFLQCGVSPPVLPCLQHSFAEKYGYLMDLVKLRTSPSYDIAEPVLPPSDPFESKNTHTLGELLVNFLQYFAIKFDYTVDAVSIRTGSTVSIKSCMNNRARKNDPHQWKYMCIEEPFEHTNTARSVYDRDAFDRIRGVFFASWQRLVLSSDLESIFSIIQIAEARQIGARLRERVILVYKRIDDPSLITNVEITPAGSGRVKTENEEVKKEDQSLISYQAFPDPEEPITICLSNISRINQVERKK